MSGGEPRATGAPNLDFSCSLHVFLCRFWSLLAPYLPTHSICSLPFVTSFCLGMGTRRVRYGQVRGSPCRMTGAVRLLTGPRDGEEAALSPCLGVSPGRGGRAWVSVRGRWWLRSSCPIMHTSNPAFVLQEEAVGPWYHPGAQEIQPLFGEHRLEGDGRGWVKTHVCLADAWNGGSSLLVQGVIPPEFGHVAVR